MSRTNTPTYIHSLIIGVVVDSQFRSLRFEPRPEIFTLFPEVARYLSLRFEGKPQDIRTAVEKVWRALVGKAVINAGFVERDLSRVFDRERNEGRLLIAFSFLSIFIACLGLYGMTVFTVERRVKEIGLRKVMGAKVPQIAGLLLWQFSRPVLLANLFAWPIALWAMRNWLERFPYQMGGWWLLLICLAAACAALVIAWLTVAGNTTRVARRNPVHALRYE